MRQYTQKEFIRICKANGYDYLKHNGSHAIYRHAKNGKHVSIPKKLNSCIALRLIKENKLKIEK